jgi:hypothetical protein
VTLAKEKKQRYLSNNDGMLNLVHAGKILTYFVLQTSQTNRPIFQMPELQDADTSCLFSKLDVPQSELWKLLENRERFKPLG